MTSNQPNATMVNFGYPESLVMEFDHWVVLVRPVQCTLGALVLINKSEVQAFSMIGETAFRELDRITQEIEQSLSSFRPFNKINYLMLMMVDKEVHFHVLPRYDSDQQFSGLNYTDVGWPSAPDLSTGVTLDVSALSTLVDELKSNWN